MKIFTKNEYGPLKSIIVGRAKSLAWPSNDEAFDQCIKSSKFCNEFKGDLIPEFIQKQTEEDLEKLVNTLEKYKVEVYRPIINQTNWSYSARDILLSVGSKIIECPTKYISRRHEANFYNHVKDSAIKDGCKWIKAPAPENDDDPFFDAANVCKFDDKLLYLVSSTGNRAGAEWLQTQVDNEFEVVIWEDVYAFAHIDSTIISLNKNTIMLNSSRVSYNSLPLFLRNHHKIWINDVVSRDFFQFPFASKWIGLNILSIDPETVIVDSIQKKLIERLQDAKFKVIELELRHSRTLGGGFHCVTCDLERE